MSEAGGLFRDITRINRSAFSLLTGLRGGIFVSLPLLLGIVTGQTALVYTTLGALFLTNTEGPLTSTAPADVLLVACFMEPVAFGLGTLVGTTGLFSIPLAGLGIFVALMLALHPKWVPASNYTAMIFAVGIGLPGGSTSVAGIRLVFSLIGVLWAFLSIELHRFIVSRRARGSGVAATAPHVDQTPLAPRQLLRQSEAFKHAAIVGIVSALGFALGTALGLPRDFWIVVTVILAVRPSIGATLSFTTMMVLGTLAGAVVAAAITLEIANDYVLWVMLLAFAIATYATRGTNLGLTQIFLVPFIIILLNIIYPGRWELAEVRILDVAIGGALSVLSVYVVGRTHFPNRTPKKVSGQAS